MPGKLSEVLEFLAGDGEWHTVGEVAEAVGISLEKAEKLLRDLSEFRFIHFDEEGRVRIDPELKRLLTL
jgi:DNA-binding IclR family transcriptional regulator